MPTMIKHLLGAEKKNVANLDTIGTLYRGHYLVTFTNGNVFGGDTVSVQWKHKIREEVSMAINNTFKFALKSYACSHKFYDSFQVRAYTSALTFGEIFNTKSVLCQQLSVWRMEENVISFLHGTIFRHIASY